MARTAKVRLAIYDDGIFIGDADSIDFTGAGVNSSYNNGQVTANIPGGGGGTANIIFGEVVAGSATTFTLSQIPVGTVSLAANGQVLKLAEDYTIAGAVITTLSPWSAGSVIASYQY